MDHNSVLEGERDWEERRGGKGGKEGKGRIEVHH